jgi:hypothetical protein
MTLRLSRRRFIALTAASVLASGGFGLVRAVQRVRTSARSTSDL